MALRVNLLYRLVVSPRRALLVLSHAYSSKQLCVPAAALQRWLRLGSAREALAACAHYGLAALENNVRFSKADFKTDVPLVTNIFISDPFSGLGAG